MTKPYSSFGTKITPQSQPIPGSTQTPNDAGGYAWQVDDWGRLDRFLILGTQGGTYYVGEQELTRQNAENVLKLIQQDGQRVVNRAVQVSDLGLAPRNDPALFVHAAASVLGDEPTRKLAYATLSQIARIGTHLFHWAAYREQFGGWSYGSRKAVQRWYLAPLVDHVAYQAVKYQQRDGWSHRDLLRLSHPVSDTLSRAELFDWIVDDQLPTPVPEDLRILEGFDKVRHAQNIPDVCAAIADYNLPWEAIPTEWLKHAQVWDALLPRLPITAMIRNLGRMSANGLLKPMSAAAKFIVAQLGNHQLLKSARVHPMTILFAERTYEKGQGMLGNLKWDVVGTVVDALDAAFYLTFGNITPINKPIMVAVDASGSMAAPIMSGFTKANEFSTAQGKPGPLTCREAAVALALITVSVESEYIIVGYTEGKHIAVLPITPRQRLTDAMETLNRMVIPQGTDCALPILFATQNKIDLNGIVQLTDSQTWAGHIHPAQALKQYRNKVGHMVRMPVVAMTSASATIADPYDKDCLDVVGLDPTTPQLISDFVAGKM